jgi:hypothetical protein
MLTNTSYGSSRFKVSTDRQLNTQRVQHSCAADLQQKYVYGPMDSTKGILFYCDEIISVCYTMYEGIVSVIQCLKA